jgi:hypothetical protein
MYSTDRLVAHPLLTAAGTASAALGTAVRGRAWQLADDQVQDAIGTVLRIEAQAAALRATLIAEATLRGLRERTQASTTERWLTDRYRLSTADARTRVAQADQLARHPILTDALTRGEVTVEQAGVIGGVLDQVADLPLVEDGEREQAAALLVEQAATLTPRELARVGQQIVEHLTRAPTAEDPAEADEIAREQRRAEEEAEAATRDLASWRHRLRPGRRGRGTLDTGPVGDALIKAWEHHAGRPHPGTDGFADTRSRDQRLGQALLDLIAADLGAPRPTAAHDSDQEIGEPGDPDDAGQSTPLFDDPTEPLYDTDNPTDTCTRQAAEPSGQRPVPVGARAVLAVTVTLAELRAALTGHGPAGAGGGVLDTGAALTPAELRLLACDAGIIPAVLGSPSQVLDLGRATRSWTIAQRRALAIRDRGCTAPGCDRAPGACHGHHAVTTWAAGGPTDIDNAALLCDHHHHQVHRQRWQVILAANGYPALIPPASIDPQQRPRQHHRFRLQLLTTRQRS